MGKEVKIWYDGEGDHIEVISERKAGYFRETENDVVMEKVDEERSIICFYNLRVRGLKEQEPLSITLRGLAAWQDVVSRAHGPGILANLACCLRFHSVLPRPRGASWEGTK